MKVNHFLLLPSSILLSFMLSCNNADLLNHSKRTNRVDSTMLGANLYLQSAAEYAFLCKQTYENASAAVSALSEHHQGDKSLAVVMDLDETVLDNSAYQNHLFNSNESYTPDTWDRFVKDGAVKDSLITLVPGAYEFIHHCKSNNIRVIFISNRMNSTRRETAITLAKLGIDTIGLNSDDSRLMLLRTDVRNKDARRDTVRKYYDPQIFIGDNISDFTSELEGLDQEGRRLKVLNGMSKEIGKRWFLIPNMTYGDWVSGSELRNADYKLENSSSDQ